MSEIDYTQIDEKCIPIVKYFNSIGLITKFSCQGHNNHSHNSFSIMFDDSIGDEIIYQYIEKYSNAYNHTPFCGKFTKWVRKVGTCIVANWNYSVDYGECKFNQRLADNDMVKMKQIIVSN